MSDDKFVDSGSSKPVFLQEKVEWVRKPADIVSNMGDYDAAYKDFSWTDVEKHFTWSETGKVNVVHEIIDRHCAEGKGDKVALWFLDDGVDEKYTFNDLKEQSSKVGNFLKSLGVGKGDCIATLLPRNPKLFIAILGINRIGAVPVPLFEAFMEQAIFDRMENSNAKSIITTPALKERVPTEKLPDMKFFVMVGGEDHGVEMTDSEEASVSFSDSGANVSSGLPEYSYEHGVERASAECEPEWLTIDDPLIIHYTSGSTGRAKGAVHRQYAMVGHYQTAKWALDLTEDDIYWCTADPGWVTGTSYGIYGPWSNAVTSVVLGGRFGADRWFDVIQKCKVTMWYSAPTAYRMLMSAGDDTAAKYDFSSLRHVCSVGEPLNPEALRWIWKVTGHAPHETWWMTETGMQLICNYRGHDFKVGCTGKPFPGTYASVVNDEGEEVAPFEMGYLVIKPGWPSMMVEVRHNHEKYQEYFRIPGWYTSGDSAYKDEDGYLWYAGRIDDVIKTSGERVGPFEVESALVQHPAVAEAGVIGKPDPVRGQIIKAFVALRAGYTPSDQLKDEIAKFVRNNLAAHCMPKEIDFVEKVPKTRSGKIMRRVLKAWDLGLPTGDISTMED